MIDWDALRADMPRIVDQLRVMMTEDAIPAMTAGPLSDIEAWPAVEISYTMKSGEHFKVRLSIDQDVPEAEAGS